MKTVSRLFIYVQFLIALNGCSNNSNDFLGTEGSCMVRSDRFASANDYKGSSKNGMILSRGNYDKMLLMSRSGNADATASLALHFSFQKLMGQADVDCWYKKAVKQGSKNAARNYVVRIGNRTHAKQTIDLGRCIELKSIVQKFDLQDEIGSAIKAKLRKCE